MTTIATLRYTVGGALVNADTVTLSDAAATYGIRRVGDGAVMLAAGAAVTNPSTGIYTYDYGALGLDPDHSYEISFKAVKSGQTTLYEVGTIAASPSAASLRNVRRALAKKLVAYEHGRTGVQAAPPTGAYVGVASGAEAARRLVTSDLASTERSGAAPTASVDQYNFAWVYLPVSGVQRRVAKNGFYPSQDASDVTGESSSDVRVGVLVFERAVAAALTAGLEFEIHSRLPVLDGDGLPGLHSCINRALRTLRVPDRLSITGVSNQYRYDLSAYPWLTHEAQLAAVWDREEVSGMDPWGLPGRSRLRLDGGTPYLVIDTPVATGQTFYVDVYRPAFTWIKVGGTWGSSTAGLVNETDEAAVNLDRLVLVAAYFAAEALAMKDPRGQEAFWLAKQADYAQAARPYLEWGQPGLASPSPMIGANAYGDSAAFLARRGPASRSGRGWP